MKILQLFGFAVSTYGQNKAPSKKHESGLTGHP